MSHVPDDKLLDYSHRVKGKVLVITGGASGIGKATALLFAAYGARVVIGDMNPEGAQKVVDEIESAGGNATCTKCNVVEFEQQAEMFELAMKKYGAVDIVIPNAGISELEPRVGSSTNGKVAKPSTKTIDVNLTGVIYTVHLAMHYLLLNKQENDLKSLILIGSTASWMGIPGGALYSASKHAILGLMRSLHPGLAASGVRVGSMHPFFIKTNMVDFLTQVIIAGLPIVPIERMTKSIVDAATDPDMETSGAGWLLLDDGPLFIVPKEEFKLGVYQMIDERVNAAQGAIKGFKRRYLLAKDVWLLFGKPLSKVALAGAAIKYAYENKGLIASYAQTLIK